MTNPNPNATFDPADQQQWQTWAAGVDLLREHELTLHTSHVAANGDVLLTFDSPHQDSASLIALSLNLPEHLPEDLRDRYVMVDRSHNPEHHSAPPRITIGLMTGADQDSNPFTFWSRWVSVTPVMQEFSATLEYVSTDGDTDSVTLRLCGIVPDSFTDFQSELPRIAPRLPVRYHGAALTAERGIGGTVILNIKPATTSTSHMPVPIDSADGQLTCAVCGGRVFIADGDVLHTGDPATLAALAAADAAINELTDETPATHGLQPASAKQHRKWQVLLRNALINFWENRHRDEPLPAGYPDRTVETIIVGVATVFLGLIALTAAAAVIALGVLAGHALAHLADMARDGNAARPVLGPVRSWIDANTSGMPFPPSALVLIWAATGVITSLHGWLNRNIGARIGWCLWGVATAWMVWHGTSIGSQEAAVGILGVWWTCGSLLVFRRGGTPKIIAHVPGLVVDSKNGLLSAAQFRLKAAREGLTGLIAVFPGEEEEGPRPVDLQDVPRWRADANAEIDTWERLINGIQMPGHLIFNGKTPITGRDGTDLGFVVRYVITQTPGSSRVCTVDTVRRYTAEIAAMIAERMSTLFPHGVTDGAVTIEAARNEFGSRLVDEVELTVWTAQLIEPTSPHAVDLLVNHVTACGSEGISLRQLLPELREAGILLLNETLLDELVRRARTDYRIDMFGDSRVRAMRYRGTF